MTRSSSHDARPMWAKERVVMSCTKRTMTRVVITSVLFTIFVIVFVGKAERKRLENEKKLRVEYYRNAYYTAIDDMRVVKPMTKWDEERIVAKATERVATITEQIGVRQ